MKKHTFIPFLLTFILLLSGCGEGSKSGKSYEKDILRHLSYSYNEDFEVVDRIGENTQGYEKLILSPVNNPNIMFHAEIGYFSRLGDIMKSRQVSHNYIEAIFYTYSPELYRTYLGQTISDDLIAELKAVGFSVLTKYDKARDNPYLIANITEDDLIPLSQSLFNIIRELYEYKPPKTSFGTLGDRFVIPIQFEHSTHIYHFTFELAGKLPYDSYEVYSKLRREYESQERKRNDEKE